MPTDLQAETYYDMDRAAWESLRETATSMPWRMVDAGGVQQAAACIGQGAPTVVYIDGWDAPAAETVAGGRPAGQIQPGLHVRPPRDGVITRQARRRPAQHPRATRPRDARHAGGHG